MPAPRPLRERKSTHMYKDFNQYKQYIMFHYIMFHL
jgi:hypothetical protein